MSAVTDWPGVSILGLGEVCLQLLSQCGSTCNCLSRSVREIHYHFVWVVSNQHTITTASLQWEQGLESKANELKIKTLSIDSSANTFSACSLL